MAHLGNTIVNGALRVLGGENVDTINGVTVGASPKFTDASVTASSNHYTPATASGQDKTASASGATAAWSIDVVKGVTLNTDGKGHVTGISVTSGKIPGNPNTDTKVTQTADDSTDSDSYEVLFSGSANNTTATEGAKKSSRLKINPKYGRVITGGPLIVESDNAVGSYDEGIRINRGKGGYATLHIGGADGSTTGTGGSQWWIGCNPASYARKLFIAQNGSTASATYFGSDADGTVSPYLNLGTSGSIASGNTRAVTGGAVYSFIEPGVKTFQVVRGVSFSSSRQGYWAGMLRSDQAGSPTLPISNKWFHVLSMDWDNDSSNWVSQLAIGTQDDTTSGVWWRCNNATGTDISSSTWNHLIDEMQLYISGNEGKITLRTSGINKAHFYTGNANIGLRDCNSIVENGLHYYTSNGPSTTLGASTTDGALYSQAYNSSWVSQIAQDYRNGNLFVRGKNNGTWQQWLPIPSGMIFSSGSINTHYSIDCDTYTDTGQPSIWGYYVNSGPTVAEGNTAPDRSGSFFSFSYAGNGWVNQTAQNFYEHGRLFTRSREGSSFTGWFKCLDTSDIIGADIKYGHTSNAAYYAFVNINPTIQWMLSFKVTIYSAYRTRVYQICGYNYGSNHWYGAKAVRLADFGNPYSSVIVANNSNIVSFHYRSDGWLAVKFYADAYSGIRISDVCNGYNQVTNYQNLFTFTFQGDNTGYTLQSQFNCNTLSQGAYDQIDYSDLVLNYRTPTTAGTIKLLGYGGVKQLTIWGTTWAAVSGAATRTLTISSAYPFLCPSQNIEISGHDENGQMVFGYIRTDGAVFLANRSAVPVYIHATYI